MKSKPFTRTELKILIFNKIKLGLSYKEAYAEVSEDIKQLNKTNSVPKKTKKLPFKESFKELKNTAQN